MTQIQIATKKWESRMMIAEVGVYGTGMVDENKPIEGASNAMSDMSCEKRSEDEKKEEKKSGRVGGIPILIFLFVAWT